MYKRQNGEGMGKVLIELCICLGVEFKCQLFLLNQLLSCFICSVPLGFYFFFQQGVESVNVRVAN